MAFIRKYFEAKNLLKPQWLKENQAHFPPLTAIRTHLGMASYPSTEENESGWEGDEYLPDSPSSPNAAEQIRMYSW